MIFTISDGGKRGQQWTQRARASTQWPILCLLLLVLLLLLLLTIAIVIIAIVRIAIVMIAIVMIAIVIIAIVIIAIVIIIIAPRAPPRLANAQYQTKERK